MKKIAFAMALVVAAVSCNKAELNEDNALNTTFEKIIRKKI